MVNGNSLRMFARRTCFALSGGPTVSVKGRHNFRKRIEIIFLIYIPMSDFEIDLSPSNGLYWRSRDRPSEMSLVGLGGRSILSWIQWPSGRNAGNIRTH